MKYPVNIEPDGKLFRVSFPDIPEAFTQGETEEEALAMAADALETALDFYFEDKRAVPMPSPAKGQQRFVQLSPDLSSWVLRLNDSVKYRGYIPVFEQGSEGDWGAYVPDLPGIACGAETRPEKETLVREAIDLWLDDAKKRG